MHRNQPPAVGAKRRTTPPAAAISGATRTLSTPPADAAAPSRRLAARTCGWCEGTITVKDTGRLPKWCSQSCRQRAWERSRAAAAGLAAVRVVERRIEVPIPIMPTRQDWPRVLDDLARQLEDGRIYDRDLLGLAGALNAVHDAYGRRPFIRNRSAR
jgi:hypothetical protein